MRMREFREKLLYISSKPRKKEEGDTGWENDSYRTATMLEAEATSLDSASRTYGDRNGRQITILTIKYLITIYLFSLKWNDHLFKEELEELDHLKSIFIDADDEIDEEILEFQLTTELQKALKSSQPEILEIISVNDFYNLEIRSPVLLYLLYFLVSYGSGDKLIKDFGIIAAESEKLQFKKSMFIYQNNFELYKDDMLLTMLLEPLANNSLTPTKLVDKYNSHLDYYNDLLRKDDSLFSSSEWGNKTGQGGKSLAELKLEDKISLFPNEESYLEITFPDQVTQLDNESKKKILTVIFDLFNLRISREYLDKEIRENYKNDLLLLELLTSKIDNLAPKTDTIDYHYTNIIYFRVLQQASSLSSEYHFVFNHHIIQLLQSLSSHLPNETHPFVFVERKDI